MYYTFGDFTIHFSMLQGDHYAASWEGGSAANSNWDRFIETIHQQTGIDKEEINKAAAKCYGLNKV